MSVLRLGLWAIIAGLTPFWPLAEALPSIPPVSCEAELGGAQPGLPGQSQAGHNYANVSIAAVLRGKLTNEQLAEAAASPEPVHIFAGVPSTGDNHAYIEAIEQILTEPQLARDWPAVRAQLTQFLKTAGRDAVAREAARETTALVFHPKPITPKRPGSGFWGKTIEWLGDVVYVFHSNKESEYLSEGDAQFQFRTYREGKEAQVTLKTQDGRFLQFWSAEDRQLTIRDLFSRENVFQMMDGRIPVSVQEFNPLLHETSDGKILLVTHKDGLNFVYDLTDPNHPQKRFEGESEGPLLVSSVAGGPTYFLQYDQIFIYRADQLVPVAKAKELASWLLNQRHIQALPDGSLLIAAGAELTNFQFFHMTPDFNVLPLTVATRIKGIDNFGWSLTDKGRAFFSGLVGGEKGDQLELLEPLTGRRLYVPRESTGSTGFHRPQWTAVNGLELVAVAEEFSTQIKVYDFNAGLVGTIDLERNGALGSFAWSPDGRKLAVLKLNRELTLFDCWQKVVKP